jgi:hypothetical protein
MTNSVQPSCQMEDGWATLAGWVDWFEHGETHARIDDDSSDDVHFDGLWFERQHWRRNRRHAGRGRIFRKQRDSRGRRIVGHDPLRGDVVPCRSVLRCRDDLHAWLHLGPELRKRSDMRQHRLGDPRGDMSGRRREGLRGLHYEMHRLRRSRVHAASVRCVQRRVRELRRGSKLQRR